MALRKGTRGNDVLVGTGITDLIVADRGNDVLRGLSGDDAIIAGPRNDSEDGGAGNGTIRGAGGADTLLGGDGNDYIDAAEFGSDAAGTAPGVGDRIYGGVGDDTLNGIDRLTGGSGVDKFAFSVRLSTNTDSAHITDFSLADDLIVLSSLIRISEMRSTFCGLAVL